MDTVICTPDPCLMESMRSVGYDLSTAIADIIDNSIAANASRVAIHFFNAGEKPYIAIIDDGDGMGQKAAVHAMQLGGNDPTKPRQAKDLGRFGLGLKTASLSQARSLLISSKQQGSRINLLWDLDKIAASRQWALQSLDDDETDAELPQAVLDDMPTQHGTCVLWRNLDRLSNVSGSSIRDVDSAMQDVAGYLGLVFHRFLRPYPGDDISPITITINGESVPTRDPFLLTSKDNNVVRLPMQRLAGIDVSITGYTLPFQNKLTQNDKKLLGLTEKGKNLFETQGFYIYRAYRLITWGSWYRLLPRKEATKLSRVRVDIPNSLDAEWTLDIKKAIATPPKVVRDAMKQYVTLLAKPSSDIQRFRGRRTSNDPESRLWEIMEGRGGVHRYEINDSNPLVAAFLESLDDRQLRQFNLLKQALSTAIPIEDIQARYTQDEKMAEPQYTRERILPVARMYWTMFADQYASADEFIEFIRKKEPFSLCKDVVEVLKEVTNE